MPTDYTIKRAVNMPEPPETWDEPIPYQLTPKGEEMATKKEILDALYSMYIQYCSNEGHLFMSAGEHASSILEEHGYIKTDGRGIITEDLHG